MDVIVSIDESRINEFKSFLEKFNAKVINFPKELIVSSVEEVRERVKEAEDSEFISEEEEKEIFNNLYKKYNL